MRGGRKLEEIQKRFRKRLGDIANRLRRLRSDINDTSRQEQWDETWEFEMAIGGAWALDQIINQLEWNYDLTRFPGPTMFFVMKAIEHMLMWVDHGLARLPAHDQVVYYRRIIRNYQDDLLRLYHETNKAWSEWKEQKDASKAD